MSEEPEEQLNGQGKAERPGNSNGNPPEGVPGAGQAGSFSVSGMYREWFLDYASYVILERAVPALYDGLKPVQRRILHSMKVLDDGRSFSSRRVSCKGPCATAPNPKCACGIRRVPQRSVGIHDGRRPCVGIDAMGHPVLQRALPPDGHELRISTSQLSPAAYHYVVYSAQDGLLGEGKLVIIH